MSRPDRAGARAPAALDIRDGAAVERGVRRRSRATRGGSTSSICTPSINVRKPILKYTDEEFDRVLDVNIKGNFNVLQAAGRVMTASGSGSIMLFSSIRSQVVEPGQSVYAVTKAGIVQLATRRGAEFGPFGVRVNAIGPGVIETPLTAPIKANKEWYDAYAAKSAFNRWARARRDGRADVVPRVGRGQLRDRHDPLRRRRLDRGRRPVHAAGM